MTIECLPNDIIEWLQARPDEVTRVHNSIAVSMAQEIKRSRQTLREAREILAHPRYGSGDAMRHLHALRSLLEETA
jgi:hypothetical protein